MHCSLEARFAHKIVQWFCAATERLYARKQGQSCMNIVLTSCARTERTREPCQIFVVFELI